MFLPLGSRFFSPILVTVALIGPAVAEALAGGGEPRYLNFTAKDRHGIYLRNLEREEVSLWLDGEPIEVGYLGYRNVDTAFCLLIENSHRTAQFKESLPQWGQVNLIDRVRNSLTDGFLMTIVETGSVMLAEIGLDRRVLQDFSRNDDELSYALRLMKPHPSSTERRDIQLGRHLSWALDVMRERREKRKIIVLFTTTVDRESLPNLNEYKDMFRLSDAELYVVSFALARPTGSQYSAEEKLNRHFFKQLAESTAGKLYLSGEHVFVEEFMNDLVTRLANSYTAGFYVDPEEERRERKVRLFVRDKKVKVTHRKTITF